MTKKIFQKGFTLMELLIVLTTVGFLVAMVVSFLMGQTGKANDAKKKGHLDRIKIALEEYEKDHNCYPPPELVVCKPDSTGLVPYLENVPCDPVSGASYFYEYETSSCVKWFHVYTVLQNTKDPAAMAGIGPLGAFNYVVSSDNAPLVEIYTAGSDPGGSTPVPSGSGGSYLIPDSGWYGCKVGICTELNWDTRRPGPECDPNYQSPTCLNQCGPPATECNSWQ